MKLLLIPVFVVMTIASWAQTLAIDNAAPIIVCPGANVNLLFSHSGINADNNFLIEVSDQNGSFDSPLVSTTIAGNNIYTASIAIPNSASISTNRRYKIRISSSSPVRSYQTSIDIGIPTPIITGNSSFCENGSVTLSSQFYDGTYSREYILEWFKDNALIANVSPNYGQFLKTNGKIEDIGEYKVKVSIPSNAGGCSAISAGKAVSAMAPAPTPPTVTASPNPVVSGSGTILTATGCTTLVNFYDSTTTQYALSSDYTPPYTFSINEISVSKTYYANCMGNNNLCLSTRAPVEVIVDGTNAPNPPTLSSSLNDICAGSYSSVTLTASNCSGIVRWYSVNPTTPIETDNAPPYEYTFSLGQAGTYTFYADCRINGILSTSRSSININIKPKPSSLSLSPSSLTVNSGSNISIYATGCTNGITKWYDAYQDGNLLFTGTVYTQNNVVANTTIYASCTANGCESGRSSVNITIGTQVQPPQIYAPNQSFCGSGSQTLIAIGCSNGTVKWYDASQNGNLLGTGQTFETPILNYVQGGNNFYNYYADCTIGSITSSFRQSRSMSVYFQPGNPTANNGTIPCNTMATLVATGCNGSYAMWYPGLTSTTYLSSGSSYRTPNLLVNTTYYVACKGNSCESERIPVVVTVQCPQPPVISANPNTGICAGNTVNLSASGCSGGIVNWSDGGVGSSRAITPTLSLTLTATCTINGFTGGQSNILSIEVNPKPILVITNPASVSPPNTVNLTAPGVTAGSTLPSGTTLSYYTDAGATTPLNNSSAVGTSGTYYIKATSAAGCTDIKPVIVTISNCASPLTLVSPTDDYNSGTQIKKTNETITATNKITGTANVTYRSGKSVTLSEGFKVDNGTIFKAEIGDCN